MAMNKAARSAVKNDLNTLKEDLKAGAREETAGEPARRRCHDAAARRSRTSPGSPAMPWLFLM